MKSAAVVLGVLLLCVVCLSAYRGGGPLVWEGLRQGWRETTALLPLLIIIFLFTGFVQVLLPPDIVASWLSDASGFRGIAVAWLAGALTPGGGPIGLPIAATLVRSGAGVSVVITYLTSLSVLSFIRLPLEIAVYGGRLTVLRVLASLLLPPVAGLLAQALAPFLPGRS